MSVPTDVPDEFTRLVYEAGGRVINDEPTQRNLFQEMCCKFKYTEIPDIAINGATLCTEVDPEVGCVDKIVSAAVAKNYPGVVNFREVYLTSYPEPTFVYAATEPNGDNSLFLFLTNDRGNGYALSFIGKFNLNEMGIVFNTHVTQELVHDDNESDDDDEDTFLAEEVDNMMRFYDIDEDVLPVDDEFQPLYQVQWENEFGHDYFNDHDDVFCMPCRTPIFEFRVFKLMHKRLETYQAAQALRRERLLAMCMAFHARLGAESPLAQVQEPVMCIAGFMH